MQPWQVENCITLACTVILALRLYAMGAGGHSFWAMLLLLNINSPMKYEETNHDNQRARKNE